MPKLLLDENIPVQFRDEFGQDFDVYTVRYMGWSSLEDSDLLIAIEGSDFDFLITADKKLHSQNRLDAFRFQVITILTHNNRLQHLLPFVSSIEKLIREGFTNKNVSITAPDRPKLSV